MEPNEAGSGGQYELDEAGFLRDSASWDESFPQQYAQEELCPGLEAEHWSLIRFARRYFLEHGQAPMPPEYAKHTRMSVGAICKLFPRGLISIARLAGLPQPKSC